MRKLLGWAVAIGKSPWVSLGLGAILVIASSVEVFEEIGNTLGAEHGVLVYGIVQTVKALFEVAEGFVKVGEGVEEIDHGRA